MRGCQSHEVIRAAPSHPRTSAIQCCRSGKAASWLPPLGLCLPTPLGQARATLASLLPTPTQRAQADPGPPGEWDRGRTSDGWGWRCPETCGEAPWGKWRANEVKAPRQEPAGARTEPQLRGPTVFCGHTASGAWSGRGRGFLSTSTSLRWLSSVTAPSTTHHCQPESRPVGKLPRRPSGWHPTPPTSGSRGLSRVGWGRLLSQG